MSNKYAAADSHAMSISNDQLVSDFKTVISDTEALLKATANQGDSALNDLRARTQASLAVAKDNLTDLQEAVMVRSREAVRATDVYVHENPWQAIGTATGLGLLIGFIMGRR
jgi:ElaB/YqjD/DUF883 family membrane-anchored ribosome-binding protein